MTTPPGLFTPQRFADAIRRIAERRATRPSATRLQEGGVSLATMDRHRDRVARLLVDDLLAGRLAERPGRMYAIRQDGKERRLFEFPLVEMILQDAVAGWLAECAATALSPRLYSYRTGMSYHGALRDFARYVRRSRAGGTAGWGLFVLRRDVRSYFDSIPVRDGAPLWTDLEAYASREADAGAARALVRRALRPQLLDARGAPYRLVRGIPTGSPVANVVANLYLRTMDEELSRRPEGFYARYGDDIVLAHADPAVAAALGQALGSHLRSQEVEGNPDKRRDCYLTAAGRPAPPGCSFHGAADVEFLGHRITALGTVGLSRKKTRALLAALRRGAANAARAEAATLDQRVGRIVQSLNAMLAARSAAAHPYAVLLRTTVTDRKYLAWLDHELAAIALEAAFGTRRVANFRRMPPRVLRTRFRLRSLVAARNRDRG